MSERLTNSRELYTLSVRTRISGVTTAAQNEREKEQDNTCLSDGLKGLADCTPPISEPSEHSTHSQTERQPSNISQANLKEMSVMNPVTLPVL